MQNHKTICRANEFTTLRKKCPYSELFWSVFSRIRIEYGEIRSIQSEHRKIRTRKTPNLDIFHAVPVFIRRKQFTLYRNIFVCLRCTLKAVNHFCKTLHFRFLIQLWMLLWLFWTDMLPWTLFTISSFKLYKDWSWTLPC